jgi:hypothetical protein
MSLRVRTYGGVNMTVFSVIRSGAGVSVPTAICCALVLGACARVPSSPPSFASAPEVAAPARIDSSFSRVETPAPNPLRRGDKSVGLAIARSALEKEFLLRATLIPQAGVPLGQSLQSRVVAFREREGKLYLLEAAAGHQITAELPPTLVLAEFPILEETEGTGGERWIRFDFNAGMSAIFQMNDWFASDLSPREYRADDVFLALRARLSFLEEVRADREDRLVVRQIAQLAVPRGGSEANTTVEVRYFLEPYRPDPTYTPVYSNRAVERIGFFETAPRYTEDGRTRTFATRFHPDRPIVFAMTANTPAAFRDAVREGILYWNRAFGREVVKVVDAPAGVSAPDSELNLMQWVNWDAAGFAYADAQMDPRSGQIVRAQSFMTSVFAVSGRAQARVRLRRLRDPQAAELPAGMAVTLRGFAAEAPCRHADLQSWPAALGALLADPQVDDAAVLRLSQDYVRHVVAHEVGHNLGLRHNFAGSLATNFPLALRDAVVESYVRGGKAPAGTVVTTTVMDYLQFFESGISGAQARDEREPHEYDRAAIGVLYRGETPAPEALPLFCTDSHSIAASFLDCRTFDTGASAVEFSHWTVREQLGLAARQLLERYIDAATRQGDDGRPTRPEFVPLPGAEGSASLILAERVNLLRPYAGAGLFLPIERSFPAVGDFNRPERRDAHLAYLAGETSRLGGIEAMLALPVEGTAERALAQFERLLATYAARARHYLFATEGDPIAVEVEFPVEGDQPARRATLRLPRFRYPVELRLTAAGLLKGGRAEALEWGLAAQGELKADYEKLLTGAFTRSLGGLKPETLPRPAARWLIENQRVLGTL